MCNSRWHPTLIRQNGVVIDELVDYDKYTVEVQYFKKITNRNREHTITNMPQLIKQNRMMLTCTRLDLETLGS